MYDFYDLYWSDSELKTIIIKSNVITVCVFNDALEKDINIVCEQCVGMTQINTWDEVIIENITLSKTSDTNDKLIHETKEYYGLTTYDSERNWEGDFLKLNIQLLNDFPFSIICKSIKITTNKRTR